MSEDKITHRPTAEIVMGGLVDLAAVVIVGLLAYASKLSTEFAAAIICLLAGVRLSDLVTLRKTDNKDGGNPPIAGGLAVGLVSLLGLRHA